MTRIDGAEHRAEINEKETKETVAKISKTKSWFFEKIKKIGKLLARLINKKREKNQVNKIRKEKGETTTDNTEIQRMVRNYYQQLYANKMDNFYCLLYTMFMDQKNQYSENEYTTQSNL